MSNKFEATFHGAPSLAGVPGVEGAPALACDGRCCPRPHGTGPRRPFPVCHHLHACDYHRGHTDTADRLHEQAYTWRGATGTAGTYQTERAR